MATVSKKLFNFVILLPLAIVLIVLCVANRQAVTLALNPFQPSDATLSFTAPFFVFLFFAVIIGVIFGSVATWLSQGHYRRDVRRNAKVEEQHQREAQARELELQRELDLVKKQAAQNSGLLR